MSELGAAILNTCAPAGNRRAVQDLAFNKLRFIEVSHALATYKPSAVMPAAYAPRNGALKCHFRTSSFVCDAASLCVKQTPCPWLCKWPLTADLRTP